MDELVVVLDTLLRYFHYTSLCEDVYHHNFPLVFTSNTDGSFSHFQNENPSREIVDRSVDICRKYKEVR